MRPFAAARVLAALLPLLALLVAPAFTFPSTGVLTGRITDAATGDALPGASVVLDGSRYGAAADADGRYRLVAPEGTYDLVVSYVGYAPRTVEGVEIADGEVLTLDVALGTGAWDEDEVVGYERPRAADEASAPRSTTTGESARREARRGDGATAVMGAPSAPPPHAPPPPPAPSMTGAPPAEAAPDREAAEPHGLVDDGRRGDPWQQHGAGLLTAGDIDDHLNWDWFTRYARRALRQDASQALPALDLTDRVTVRILDRNGRPASNAVVRLTPEGRRGRALDLVAGTDGRLHLYPAHDFGARVRRVRMEVRPPSGGTAHVERLDLGQHAGPVTVRLRARAELPQALDVAVVLDVTGSMADEHRYLTDEFESIVERVRRQHPQADLRFGLVVYRDHGDDFVVRSYGFTGSVREMQRRLADQYAGGGGDYPEALDEALDAAMALPWRGGNTARVLFLVADAPPHDGRFDDALAQAAEARARGIRIYPVAASGAADAAEYLMRTAAVLTQGRHLFLTDDSGIGYSHEEPKVACYVVTALDRQLVRAIDGELAGRRIEPDRQDVVREVGRYEDGVCVDQPITYVPRGQR